MWLGKQAKELETAKRETAMKEFNDYVARSSMNEKFTQYLENKVCYPTPVFNST